MSLDKLLNNLLPYQQGLIKKHFEDELMKAQYILNPNHVRPIDTHEREQLLLRSRLYAAAIAYIDNRTPLDITQ